MEHQETTELLNNAKYGRVIDIFHQLDKWDIEEISNIIDRLCVYEEDAVVLVDEGEFVILYDNTIVAFIPSIGRFAFVTNGDPEWGDARDMRTAIDAIELMMMPES